MRNLFKVDSGKNHAGLTKFDNKLADLMSTGAISSQKAISVQRNFTQEMLNRQFTIEAARDPDGAYLKILNGDYYFEFGFSGDTIA